MGNADGIHLEKNGWCMQLIEIAVLGLLPKVLLLQKRLFPTYYA